MHARGVDFRSQPTKTETDVDHRDESKSAQSAVWTGGGGRGWVELQDLIDRLFQGIDDLLVGAISPETGGRALDIGCGTGGTTVAVARRLGANGSVTGIDVSDSMIEAARARAERARVAASFVVADAQSYAFERASFDVLVSRFGVMFFDDPVEAFSNLRRAARNGAVLRCVVWRSAEENPFMTTAERAAAPLLPDLPVRRPNEPGQFGFADPDRVRAILEESGWAQIDLRAVDVPCAMAESSLAHYLTQLGPVGRALMQSNDELRAKVVAAVRPAFDVYVRDAEVRFTAACWLLEARA
jgi:SAM-dependent methyltransferase